MHNSDDKIVSISFDNKKFLDEVQNTIKALEQLNDAASGKNLNTSGLENAFSNLSRSATSNIDAINKTVQDTSSYSALTNSVSETSREFSALEVVAVGALLSIGNAAVGLGSQIAGSLTRGIRDGWQEYNLLVDSTQTILANTERYGTTINDVTRSLDELNDYADKTIYNFSQMTHNIGLFTTAGLSLEDSVTAIKGMSNLAALFGVNNTEVAAATYQMSQAMSSGYIRLMDWMSMERRGMGGKLLQEELVKTAAIMSGKSVDAFKEYIGYSRSFRNTLESNWLTADVFLETMRKFAGESREYWESLTASNGDRLYSDEDIDAIMHIGSTAEEAATKVRTFKMMMDSVAEAIGSSWAQSFRILFGNLEEAKDFWTPINEMIAGEHGIITSIADFRNSVLSLWADMYRASTIDDLMQYLEGINDILRAIGAGFVKAFGRPGKIAQQIGLILEPLSDLAYTLRLDEDELQDITDLVAGLLAPFTLVADVIREVVRIFFNAGDAMNEFDTRTGSLVDTLRPIRKAILNVVGAFGRFLTIATQIVRETGIIHKSFSVLSAVLRVTYNIVSRIFGGIFSLLRSLWNRYNITDVLVNFTLIANNEIIKLGNAINSLIGDLKEFFYLFTKGLGAIDLDPLNDLYTIFNAIETLIKDILDPTMSLAAAMENFKAAISSTSVYRIINYIALSFRTLIGIIRSSELGPYIDQIGNILSKVYTIFKYTIGAIIYGVLRLKDILSTTDIGEYISSIGTAFQTVFNKLKRTRFGEFISNITTNISTSLGHLSVIFRGNKVTREAISFIGDVKDALTVEGGLPKNNIISFVKDISDKVNNTAGKLANGETFKQVKDVLENVKDTSKRAVSIVEDIRNSNIDSAGMSLISTVFGTIMEVIRNVGERLSAIGSGVFNAVKNGLQWIADTLSLMASGERYRDLDNAQRFYDIVQMFIRIFTKIASSVLMFLTVLSGLRWASAVKSIGEGIEAFGKGIKKAFAAKQWANIASIFKTVAVLVIAIMAGIFLISKYADVDKFTEVLMSVSIAVGGLLLGVSAMVLIIMGVGASIAKSSKKFGFDSVKTIRAISNIFRSVTAILTRLMLFTYAIAKIALEASQLGDTEYERFHDSLWSMFGIFAGISAILGVLTLGVVGLSKMIAPLEAAIAPFAAGDNMLVNPIQQVLYIVKTITSQIVAIMLAMSASIAIISFVSKDANELETAMTGFTMLMGVVMAGIIGIVALIATVSKSVNLEGAMAMNGATGQILRCVNQIALAISLISITLSVSFAIITAGIAVLSGIVKLLDDESRKNVLIILGEIAAFLLLLIGEFTAIAAIAALAPTGTNMGGRILAIAGSISIMAVGIGVICTSLAALLVVTKKVAWTRLGFVALIVESIFATVGIILTALAGLISTIPTLRVSTLVGIASSFVIMSSSLSIISGSLIAIALLPLDKIKASGIAIGVIFAVMSGVLLGLSMLSTIPGGTLAMGVAVGAIFAMSVSILALGTAMLQAARGVKTYAQALQIFQTLNGNRIKKNMVSVAEAIPEIAKTIHNQFTVIRTTMQELSVTIGIGFATALFTGVEMFNTLVIANIGAITSSIGAILIGIIYGILLIVKEFLETIVKPGSILWDILDILGKFLMKAAEYVGYYGTMIIVKFIEGIVHGIQDLGLDTWVAQALNVVVTAVEQKVNEMFAWCEQRMNDFYASANAMVIDSRISGYQEQLDDVNRRIQEINWHQYDVDNDNRVEAWHHYQELLEERQGILDNMGREQQTRDNLMNYWQSEDQRIQGEVDAENSRLQDVADTVDDMLAEERRARHIFDNAPNESDYTGYSTYVPDQYRGQAMDARRSTDSLSTGISNLGNTLRNFLGLTDGQSIGDILMGFLGIKGGMDVFGSAGQSSGESFVAGFGDALETNNMDNIINADNIDYSGFQYALQESTELPEDVSNPIITPVIDDTKFNLGIDKLMDTWNNKTYDAFALDVGNSMTLREQAEGDAATDGNVSYSYTQINYSNKDLTRTELYLDNKNLLRGYGNFRLT